MDMVREVIELRTKNRLEIMDITSKIRDVVEKSDICEGVLNIYSSHSTSGVVINENESGLVSDFAAALEKLVPQGAGYKHDRIDNNADSHIRGFFLGGSQTIPVEDRRMMLGTWQSIFFVELDGPRNRKLTITIMGV